MILQRLLRLFGKRDSETNDQAEPLPPPSEAPTQVIDEGNTPVPYYEDDPPVGAFRLSDDEAESLVAALNGNLGSSDSDMHTDALIIIDRMGPLAHACIPCVQAILSSRPEVIVTLARIDRQFAAQATAYLMDELASADTDRTLRALHHMRGLQIDDPEMHGMLVSLLRNPNSSVEARAAVAMIQLGASKDHLAAAAIGLLRMLQTGTADEFDAAKQAISVLNGAYGFVVPVLRAALARQRDTDDLLRYLGNVGVGDPSAAELLTRYLTSSAQFSDMLVQIQAAKSLAKIGHAAKDALPQLQGVFASHSEQAIREVAGVALWCIDPTSAPAAAFETLANSLTSSYSLSRSMAAEYLGMIGSPARRLLPSLLELLEDEETQVRMVAACALVSVDYTHRRRAMSVLTDGLKNPDTMDRYEATMALANLLES